MDAPGEAAEVFDGATIFSGEQLDAGTHAGTLEDYRLDGRRQGESSRSGLQDGGSARLGLLGQVPPRGPCSGRRKRGRAGQPRGEGVSLAL